MEIKSLKDRLGTNGVAAAADGNQAAQLRAVADSVSTSAGAVGAKTDTPVAYDGAAEDATARSGISLWKRAANALKAIAASVAAIPAKGAAAAAASTPVTLATEDAAKVPALGQALEAASTPVVLPALQQAALKEVTEASGADIKAALGTTADEPVAYDGADEDSTARSGISLWKRMCNALKAIAASVANIPAQGAAAAVGSTPVTLATEDAAKVPSLGSAADAASVPVTMSTEDKAKVPALGQALAAASVPVVLPALQETALKAVTEASAADIKTAVQLIDDVIGTPGSAFSGKVAVVGGKATTGVPVAVANGQAVADWVDEYGRACIGGYDHARGSNLMHQTTAPLKPASPVYTLLNAVSSTQESIQVDVSRYGSVKYWVEASDSGGGTDGSIQVKSAAEVGDTGTDEGAALAIAAAGWQSTAFTAPLGVVSVALTRTQGTFTVKMQAVG
jgi:hypothetical protein